MTQTEEFDAWWAVYPHRVGKLAAHKAFTKARTQASFAELVDGVRRYIRGKPAYAEWAHPRTWLTQGRWLDEYADSAPTVRRRPTAAEWADECARLHGGACTCRWDHDTKMQESA